MKLLQTLILILVSSIVFSQLTSNLGDKILSGKLILVNNEIIQFYKLEHQIGDKISYINNQNLQPEFLYLSSIKSIETDESSILTDARIIEIENVLNIQNYDPTIIVDYEEEVTYSIIEFKDEKIQLANPKSGKAVVYFVRTNGAGFLINFRYFDYDKFIGKFAGEGYLRYECDPGKHSFWVGASNSSYVTADLEAGKIYVIETIPVMGMAYARVKIEIPNRLSAKKYPSQKKRIFKTLSKEGNDKSPSPEDLINQSDYKKEIERGIENYHEWVAKEHDHILNANQYFE